MPKKPSLPTSATFTEKDRGCNWVELEKAGGVELTESHRARLLSAANEFLRADALHERSAHGAQARDHARKAAKAFEAAADALHFGREPARIALSEIYPPSLYEWASPRELARTLTRLAENARAFSRDLPTSRGRRSLPHRDRLIQAAHAIWCDAGGEGLGAYEKREGGAGGSFFALFFHFHYWASRQHVSPATVLGWIKKSLPPDQRG